jgi:hypothetical protein
MERDEAALWGYMGRGRAADALTDVFAVPEQMGYWNRSMACCGGAVGSGGERVQGLGKLRRYICTTNVC